MAGATKIERKKPKQVPNHRGKRDKAGSRGNVVQFDIKGTFLTIQLISTPPNTEYPKLVLTSDDGKTVEKCFREADNERKLKFDLKPGYTYTLVQKDSPGNTHELFKDQLYGTIVDQERVKAQRYLDLGLHLFEEAKAAAARAAAAKAAPPPKHEPADSGPQLAPPPAGDAYSHHYAVQFREIDRLYDYDSETSLKRSRRPYEFETEELKMSLVRRYVAKTGGALREVFTYALPRSGEPEWEDIYFDEEANDLKVQLPALLRGSDPDDVPPDASLMDATSVLQCYVGPVNPKGEIGTLPAIMPQTFDRSKSTPIKPEAQPAPHPSSANGLSPDPRGRWVYVFRQAGSEDASLYAELNFQGNGKFRQMSDAALASSKKRWESLASLSVGQGLWEEPQRELSTKNGEDHDHLWLEAANASSVHYRYFFYLTEHQLPWAGIEAIRAAPSTRAIELFDRFYTDFGTKSDPSAPLLPRKFAFIKGSATEPKDHDYGQYRDKEPYYVLHLPNVLKEARLRAKAYSEALDRVNAHMPIPPDKFQGHTREQAQLNDLKTLAGIVDLLTKNDKDFRAIVKQKLFPIIYPDEIEPGGKVPVKGNGVWRTHRRWAVLSYRVRDLVNWIGTRRLRYGPPHWSCQPGTFMTEAQRTGLDEPTSLPDCAFTETTKDYYHAAASIRMAVAATVTETIQRLPDTELGHAFLDRSLRINLNLCRLTQSSLSASLKS